MNPYFIIAILLAVAGAFAGGEFDGRKTGAQSERTAWQTKDNAELAAANAKILQMEATARASEQAHAQAQADISTTYQKELQNAQAQRQKDVAAARSGALRLRDPGAITQQTCGGAAGQAATGASGRDGPADPGLSPSATEFLLTQADRSDAIVRQLGACQAVILADRVP